MDLLLWRHADAVTGTPDAERKLSEKGQHQAEKVGNWLHHHAPTELTLLVSPLVRARQTAEAFSKSYTLVAALANAASPQELLKAAGWPSAGGAVMLVGHQPTLGEVAAQLLGTNGSLSVRKGALWWFRTKPQARGSVIELRTVVDPAELD